MIIIIKLVGPVYKTFVSVVAELERGAGRVFIHVHLKLNPGTGGPRAGVHAPPRRESICMHACMGGPAAGRGLHVHVGRVIFLELILSSGDARSREAKLKGEPAPFYGVR